MLRDPRFGTLILLFAVPAAAGSFFPGMIGTLVSLLVSILLYSFLRARKAPGLAEFVWLLIQNRRALAIWVLGPMLFGVLSGLIPASLVIGTRFLHLPKPLVATVIVLSELLLLVLLVDKALRLITGQRGQRYTVALAAVLNLAGIVALSVQGLLGNEAANMVQGSAMAIVALEAIRLGNLPVKEE